MSGSSRRRKLWAASNESESECRDSGFTDGPLGSDMSVEELPPYEQQQRSRHYSADSRPSSSAGGVVAADESGRIEDRQFNYASSFTPNYDQRRLRRNRYNYLDDFDSYSEMDCEQGDSASLSRERSDSFIYVAYPPEVKKRFHQDQR
ncbi:uncharacterized protein LOC108681754 [Hyalella azteca]|uniref:Uncharacterized protein LOC108681754 n=1 Tax=Hyalella azteca TaxID=294128 RepID=A0A8B7PLP0_HYAAZ|nr:uncharacterized protein LOC108681754 [Hyalella azteca]